MARPESRPPSLRPGAEVPGAWRCTGLLGLCLLAAAAGLPGQARAQATDRDGPVHSLLPSAGERGLRYETEYPGMDYSTTPPSESIARLQARLDSGSLDLDYNPDNGYLEAVLKALDIDPASQMLVFSRTSINVSYITPENPRAVYFNDDTYVAWVPDSGMLEIASMDPNIGPIFFTLSQNEGGQTVFDRDTHQCLRCHDSLTLTGGGVPRFIMGSGYTDTRGNLVSHEGWILTQQDTPLKYRWGGWYVTGNHGKQVHLGNIIVEDPRDLQDLESMRVNNVPDLDEFLDTSQYLNHYSDIVALMVIQHQTQAQNMITRVNYDTRTALHRAYPDADGSDYAGVEVAGDLRGRIGAISEPLVNTMLFVDEARLTDRISGSSGYAGNFEELGPFDKQGRTLREFDLRTRLFRYPMSYLIYSPSFDALPEPARTYIYRRFIEILTGQDNSEDYARLSAEDRTAIVEILLDTKPEFARRLQGTASVGSR